MQLRRLASEAPRSKRRRRQDGSELVLFDILRHGSGRSATVKNLEEATISIVSPKRSRGARADAAARQRSEGSASQRPVYDIRVTT